MIDITDIRAASSRIADVVHRTPTLSCRALDKRSAGQVTAKAESLQRTGSFKMRGAYNAVTALPLDARSRGVATYSSGNHAQALARAAELHGVPATIVMPADAPTSKVAATRSMGAEIVTYDRYAADREAVAREVATARGLTLIPPYDDPAVIAGQGTAAVELIEDAGPFDVLVVPVGGGGLIAGCALAAEALAPGARVVGVEPSAGDDTRRSLQAGRRVDIAVPRTIADGQQVTSPGRLTFPIVQRLVHEVVTVDDPEIVEAMRFAAERMKLVLEPSGASALAAVLTGAVDVASLRAGVILSGGNVDLARFAELLEGGGSGAG